MIYIASPYSHPDVVIREQRFRAVCRAAAKLMSEGAIVFSPIAHSHPIATIGNCRPLDLEFWLRQDRAFMDTCDSMIVLMLPGWRESKGVQYEIEYMTKAGKPVRYTAENIGPT